MLEDLKVTPDRTKIGFYAGLITSKHDVLALNCQSRTHRQTQCCSANTCTDIIAAIFCRFICILSTLYQSVSKSLAELHSPSFHQNTDTILLWHRFRMGKIIRSGRAKANLIDRPRRLISQYHQLWTSNKLYRASDCEMFGWSYEWWDSWIVHLFSSSSSDGPDPS